METDLPLKGMRVVDFTHVASGPMTTKLLANFGAEVIKIESRKHPDLIRGSGPYRAGRSGPNAGGMFNTWNTSKLSLAIDLSQPKGIVLVKKLVAISDLVIDNFSARVMKKWEMTYGDLIKIKKDIICVSLPSHGLSGPHREYVSFGAELMALAGMVHLTGFPQGMPTGPYVNYPDYVVCYLAVLAILSAIHHRNQTGKGQQIEFRQFEVTASNIGPLIMDYTANGRVPTRQGNGSPAAAPYGVYPCRGDERWCAIGVESEEQWQSFCSVLGNPGLARDPRFQTMEARLKNAAALDDLVAGWTSERTAEEIMEAFQQKGVPAGVLENGEDLLRDPHLKERGHYVELPHPEEGAMLYQNPTIVLSRTPGTITRSPLLGEHNHYILKEILGLTDRERKELEKEGVFD